MSRLDSARLADIEDAIGAIHEHLERGDLRDGLIYDAVRVRLIEIGEAVKAISPELLDEAPGIPWSAIALELPGFRGHGVMADQAARSAA